MDSLSRHEQLLRIFHLIDILFGARHPLSIAQLKAELRSRGVIDEMSDKNIRRDLGFLQKFGYALKSVKKQTDRGGPAAGWAIEPGRGAHELSAPAVTLPELLSLAVARNFIAPLAGTVYWHGLGQLLARIEKLVTPKLLAYVDEHKQGLVVHPRPAQGKYSSRTLSAINRSIQNRLTLGIRYRSLASDDPKAYSINPEALVVYDGSIYIAARLADPARSRSSADADAIRFFKLDRVEEAKPSSRSFERSAETVESMLADSMTIFRSTKAPRRYRIRIDAARARWAAEKPFHPGQKVRSQRDGGVILEIERAWDDEMIPQLLGLAEHAEVLEPADVRDRLVDTARRIVERYRPAKPARGTRRGKPDAGSREPATAR